MTPTVEEARAAYLKVRAAHFELMQWVARMNGILRSDPPSKEELADLCHLMKLSEQLLSDAKAAATNARALTGRMASLLHVRDCLATSDGMGPIRGDLAIGTPDVKMAVRIPKLDTEPDKYFDLMDFFGVPRHHAQSRVVRLHWPEVCDMAKERAENGLPPMPGIDFNDTYPTHSLMTRTRRGADLGDVLDDSGERGNNDVNEAETGERIDQGG